MDPRPAEVSDWTTVPHDPGDWKDVSASKPQPGALARFGSGLYETTVGPVVNTIAHPIDAAAGLFNVPKMQEIAKHIQDGDYGKAALAIGQFATENPANRMATQMVGDVAHDVQEGNLAGAGGRVLGDTLMLAGPKLGEVAAGSKVGTAIGGAARGAADAATTPMSVFRPTPIEALSTAVGGYLGKEMGIPGHVAGAAVGRMAPQIVRGAVRGAKAALTQRELEAAAKAKLATETPAAVTPTEAPPVQPPRALLPPGPNVIQMGQAADGSYVRSVPAEYPSGEAPAASVAAAAPVEDMALLDDIAQGQVGKPFAKLNPAHQTLVREIARRLNQPAAVEAPPPAVQAQPPQASAPVPVPPQAETPAATAPAPAPLAKDVAQQLYDEMKRGGTSVDAPPEPEAEVNPFEAKARAKKVDALATALNDAGQGYSRMSQLSGPELASTLQASAKLLGLKEFSGESISAVMSRLQELEAAKPAQPTAMQEFQAIRAKKTKASTFGEIYGNPDKPSHITDEGVPVWMWRKGQRVRFLTADGVQVGPEQPNVGPALIAAAEAGWSDASSSAEFNRAFTAEVRSDINAKTPTKKTNGNGKRK